MRAISFMLVIGLLVGSIALFPACADRYPVEPGQGDDWLRWNQEIRTLLVYAYIGGYLDGSHHGCNVAENVLFEGQKFSYDELPAIRCLNAIRKFSRPSDYYIEKVTRFYQTYPEDRSIPAPLILRKLYDGEDKTIEELHRLAQSGALRLSP